MLQPISRRNVYEPAVVAVIDGQELEVESANLNRALPDPYARAEFTAASGVLSIVDGPDVAETVATPWDPGASWPPEPEAPASVSVDTGAGPVPALAVGRVISATGDAAGREVEVEVADRYQTLDRNISWDAVADVMPSQSEGVIGRWVGMLTSSITDMILRHCGWYATPPRLAYIALSVPAMGTMWPERGVCITSGRTGGSYPSWANVPWGNAVSDIDATYRLGSMYTIKSRGRMEMTAMTATGTGSMRLEVTTSGSAGLVRLNWTDASAVLSVRSSSGSYVTAVQIPRANGFLYATVEYVSDTSVSCTLRSGTQTSTATATVASLVTTGTVANAAIVGTLPSGGFQVAFPNTAGALTGWAPNAVLYPRGGNKNTLRVRPPIAGENCVDLLAAQCEAEAATYWIDELGILRWWDLARLESRTSVAALNSNDDIEEAGFTWSHNLSQVKSRVSVKWCEPAREMSWRTTVDLWQGNGRTMHAGDDAIEEWINVPDDEVWIMPDLTMDRLGVVSMDDFNHGIGSASGAVVPGQGDDPDRWSDQVTGTLTTSVERINDSTFKVVDSWTGNLSVVMRTPGPESSTSLWRIRRDFDLPIIRGKAKYVLADRETLSDQSGPATAPEYTIDAGWWIQLPEQAEYTANYAGARLTVPQPVLSSVHLIPVPGLQIGDVVEVEDTHVTRLTVRGLVVEDSRRINPDMSVSHDVAIRPTYVTRNRVTWREWAQEVRPKTWTSWATNQASTWAEWGKNPLLKEEEG